MPLLVAHAERTGSAIAQSILSNWPGARSAFRRVTPKAAPALVSPAEDREKNASNGKEAAQGGVAKIA